MRIYSAALVLLASQSPMLKNVLLTVLSLILLTPSPDPPLTLPCLLVAARI